MHLAAILTLYRFTMKHIYPPPHSFLSIFKDRIAAIWLALLLSVISTSVSGQNSDGCGTDDRYTEQEAEALPWFGNNQFLIEELQRRNIAIAPDYLRGITDSSRTQESRALTDIEVRNVPVYIIPLKVWIHKDANGNGTVTQAQAFQDCSNVNRLFYMNNIPLRLSLKCEITEIRNDRYYYNPSDNAINDMWSEFRDPRAINIHYVMATSTGWDGKARLPRNSAGILSGQRFSLCLNEYTAISTIAHEIGHTLGLLHTHDGGRSSNKYNEDCGDCYQESVSRSKKQGAACFSTSGSYKADVNGDFLRDTPADPVLLRNNTYRVGSQCEYPSAGQQPMEDRWGDDWKPDTRNIMSYSRSSCRVQFSPLQISAMLYWANEVGFLNNALEITGPTALCAGQSGTYTVSRTSVPGAIRWRIPPGWSISGQGTSQVTITAGGGDDQTIQVEKDCGIAPGFLTVRGRLSRNIAIAGPLFPCPSVENTYHTEALANATYTWHAPPGWQILSPNSPVTQIDPPQDFSSGQVWVTVQACGSSGDSPRLEVAVTEECYRTPPIYYPPPSESSRSSSAQSSDNALNVYPVPATDYIMVELSVKNAQQFSFELINSYGKTLQKGQCAKEALKISTGSFPRGLYRLRVWNGKEQMVKSIELK